MSRHPTELQANVQPLPEAIDQAELHERGLYVVNGLTAALGAQLVERSREPHIVEYCPNDSGGRFGDLQRIAKWQSKGRLALPLVRGLGNGALELAGFGWMGPGTPGEDEPPIPGAETTFAIRLYQGAFGQGNALPYTRAILAANQAISGDSGVWLEAWGDNEPAVRTYEHAGFQRVAEVPGTRHGKEYPRVYMTLGNIDPSTQ